MITPSWGNLGCTHCVTPGRFAGRFDLTTDHRPSLLSRNEVSLKGRQPPLHSYVLPTVIPVVPGQLRDVRCREFHCVAHYLTDSVSFATCLRALESGSCFGGCGGCGGGCGAGCFGAQRVERCSFSIETCACLCLITQGRPSDSSRDTPSSEMQPEKHVGGCQRRPHMPLVKRTCKPYLGL